MIINKQKKCYDELQIENTFAHAQMCPFCLSGKMKFYYNTTKIEEQFFFFVFFLLYAINFEFVRERRAVCIST